MNRQSPVSLPEGYIDFYKNLETWQNEQQIKMKKSYNPPPLEVVKVLSATNRPVMETVDFALDPLQYQGLFENLMQFLRDQRPEVAATVGKIADQSAQLDFALIPVKLLEQDQLYFDQLAAGLDVPVELLVFSLDHALRPFLRMWAAPYHKAFTEAGINGWDFATICPFCGSKPHFSRIQSSDGRRFMFCDHCFSEWETRNIYCVHCGNDNPMSIQYLTVEDDMAYQVYTCDECKGYIKTYDERQKGHKSDLFIANVETVYLDMLAQEKGYTSHDNN